MFGVGISELIIIIVIALVLFGTPVLAFVLGYTLGRRRGEPAEQAAGASADSRDLSADMQEEPAE